MDKVAEWQRWIRSERRALGWSTTKLADSSRRLALAAGEQMKLRQQSVSGFEMGAPQRQPAWLKYARQAIEEEKARRAGAPQPEASGAVVTLPVQLPSEAALTAMFGGMLESAGFEDQSDQLAQALAELLPVALAQMPMQLAGSQAGRAGERTVSTDAQP